MFRPLGLAVLEVFGASVNLVSYPQRVPRASEQRILPAAIAMANKKKGEAKGFLEILTVASLKSDSPRQDRQSRRYRDA
jgi:hypothetical protein